MTTLICQDLSLDFAPGLERGIRRTRKNPGITEFWLQQASVIDGMASLR